MCIYAKHLFSYSSEVFNLLFLHFIVILGQCIAINYPSVLSIMQLYIYIYIVIICSVRYACLVNE